MPPRQRANIVFSFAIVLLLASGMVVCVLIARLLQAQQLVSHTNQVQAALADVRTAAGRAGLARTLYIDSGDPHTLEEYESAASRVSDVVERIRKLSADNPPQLRNCARLEILMRRRNTLLAGSIELKRSGQSDLQRQSEITRQGAAVYAETDSLLQEMSDVEQSLLTLRTSRAAQLFRITIIILSVAFALAIGLLLLYYRLLDLELTERQAVERSVRAQAALLDAANDAIWAADLNEKITYWSRGAERLYGWTKEEALGRSPHELLRTQFPIPFDEIARQRALGGWQGELVHTRRDGSNVTVASSWTALNDAQNNLTGWLQINTDLSERKRSEESLRLLTGRLLRMQDEERRRIARELHDSAGQILAAISMYLTPFESANGVVTPAASTAIRDSLAMVSELSRELRTISHLLHPPLLDEVGLSSALRVYLEGFTERSKIAVDFEIPDDFGRLSQDLETAIFRIVQECLTNIHRHSESPVAKVRVNFIEDRVRVEVEDHGKGIPAQKRRAMDSTGTPGVGIGGMRERIRQLGGTLEIDSDGNRKGTLIIAVLPVARPSSTAAA